MSRALQVPFFVLLMLWATRSASACTCMHTGPACQAFWKTDAVFDATVDGIEVVQGPSVEIGARTVVIAEKRVRMTVRQAFKGTGATGPIDIYTATDEGACGYDFQPGRRYLVFARQRPDDGRWVASLCSATQPYDGSGGTAAFLASLTQPAQGGRVFGTIKTFDKRFDHAPVSGERGLVAVVRLVGGGREQRETSTGGGYEFRGLDPGRYIVEVEAPAGYASEFTTRNVDLPNGRACQEERFSLAPAGRVTGVVLRADGRPAANVEVELTTPDARAHPDYGLATMDTHTRNDGAFEIRGVPPGTYIVGVNLSDLPSPYNPYARTVYPSDGSGDGILHVGATDTVDVGTWKLPPPLPVIKVSGVATWTDGTPAAGAYVGVQDVTGNPVDRARGAGGTTVAADGSFTLDLRYGRTYTFFARDRANRLGNVSAPRLDMSGPLPGVVRVVIEGRSRSPSH